MAVWLVVMQPGARFTLPAAAGGDAINRMCYFTEGDRLRVEETEYTSHVAITVLAGSNRSDS